MNRLNGQKYKKTLKSRWKEVDVTRSFKTLILGLYVQPFSVVIVVDDLMLSLLFGKARVVSIEYDISD